jgi:hypothetical protein
MLGGLVYVLSKPESHESLLKKFTLRRHLAGAMLLAGTHRGAKIAAFHFAIALFPSVLGMPLEARAQTVRPTEQTGDVRQVICSILKSAAQTNDLPVDFFVRVIWQESRFRANAIGPVTYTGARALGIAQFMPGTAEERGLREPLNPVEALPKSSELLAELRHEFGNLGLAAAAYNAGPKRVREFIAGSRSLPQQTRNYVRAITRRSVENWASGAKEDVDRGNNMEPRANGNATTCPDMVAMLERSSNRSDRELQQRSVPSWCRSLHHPNISVCGSVHLEEMRWSGGLAGHSKLAAFLKMLPVSKTEMSLQLTYK